MHWYRLGSSGLRGSPSERGLGVTANARLNLSPQCALIVKGKPTLGYTGRSVTRRLREAVNPLQFSLARLCQESCLQFRVPQFKGMLRH